MSVQDYRVRALFHGEEVGVRGFRLRRALGEAVASLDVDFTDAGVLADLDPAVTPTSANLVLQLSEDGGETWEQLGAFFVEEPRYTYTPEGRELAGVWCRGATAALDKPYCSPVWQEWPDAISLHVLVAEICALSGVTARVDVPDATVPGGAIAGEGRTPLDILRELAELCGAVLTTDSQERLVMTAIAYTAEHGDGVAVLGDGDFKGLTEEYERPDYGDRIRVAPDMTDLAEDGYSMEIWSDRECLAGTGDSHTWIHVRITDGDGNAVDNLPVTFEVDGEMPPDWETGDGWTDEHARVVLFNDSEDEETAGTSGGDNTALGYGFVERVSATSRTTFELERAPGEVVSVYLASDAKRSENLAEECEVEDTVVTLAEELEYCDATLNVVYAVGGIAKIFACGVAMARGTATVTAKCYGLEASLELYVDVPCQCEDEIALNPGAEEASAGAEVPIIVQVLRGGEPLVGKLVRMAVSQGAEAAGLRWGLALLDSVLVTHDFPVENGSRDASRITVEYLVDSVQEVRRLAGPAGAESPIGLNLYASHEEKEIVLSELLPEGTMCRVSFWVAGAVRNDLRVDADLEMDTEVTVQAWVAPAVSSDGSTETGEEETWAGGVREDPVKVEATITCTAEEKVPDEDPKNYYSSMTVCDYTAEQDPDCPEEPGTEEEEDGEVVCVADGGLFNLADVFFCVVHDGQRKQVGLDEMFTIAEGGDGQPHLCLRSNARVDNAGQVGPIMLKYHEAEKVWRSDGAYLCDGEPEDVVGV